LSRLTFSVARPLGLFRWSFVQMDRLCVKLVHYLGLTWLLTAHHHAQARVSSLHLSVLLQEARVLHLRVAVPELVFGFRLPLVCLVGLVFRILLVFKNGLYFVVFELTVARIVLGVRQRQDMAALL